MTSPPADPDVQALVAVAEHCAARGEYQAAIDTLQLAVQLRGSDAAIDQELRRLAAPGRERRAGSCRRGTQSGPRIPQATRDRRRPIRRARQAHGQPRRLRTRPRLPAGGEGARHRNPRALAHRGGDPRKARPDRDRVRGPPAGTPDGSLRPRDRRAARHPGIPTAPLSRSPARLGRRLPPGFGSGRRHRRTPAPADAHLAQDARLVDPAGGRDLPPAPGRTPDRLRSARVAARTGPRRGDRGGDLQRPAGSSRAAQRPIGPGGATARAPPPFALLRRAVVPAHPRGARGVLSARRVTPRAGLGEHRPVSHRVGRDLDPPPDSLRFVPARRGRLG